MLEDIREEERKMRLHKPARPGEEVAGPQAKKGHKKESGRDLTSSGRVADPQETAVVHGHVRNHVRSRLGHERHWREH